MIFEILNGILVVIVNLIDVLVQLLIHQLVAVDLVGNICNFLFVLLLQQFNLILKLVILGVFLQCVDLSLFFNDFPFNFPVFLLLPKS